MPFQYKTDIERYRKYYQSIEPVFLSPKKRQYTMVIFSFLAVSLFGWYAIRPTIQTILYLRREIKDNIKINKQMEEKIAALIEAQATYQSVQNDMPLLSQAIPDHPNIVSLVSAMRTLASQSQASLSGVQVAETPILSSEGLSNINRASADASFQQAKSIKGEKYTVLEIPVSVTLNGPYVAVKSFINGLLTLRRIVTVDSVGFTPSEEKSSKDSPAIKTVQLSLKLKTYYVSSKL